MVHCECCVLLCDQLGLRLQWVLPVPDLGPGGPESRCMLRLHGGSDSRVYAILTLGRHLSMSGASV